MPYTKQGFKKGMVLMAEHLETMEDVLVGLTSTSKTDTMTQPVGVDDEGKLWTEPSSDSSQIAEAVEQYMQENPVEGGSGLTDAQINALDGMFKICAYTENATTAYTAFKEAFGITDSESDGDSGSEEETPSITTYTILLDLVNATSNNSASSVDEGASYTATLTAADSYELSTVTVMMGGVDVTADCYADGIITITSVTGNVEILASASAIEEDSTAELITDGLLDFFDFRNAEPAINTAQGLTSWTGSGGGSLFTWSANCGVTSTERGVQYASRNPGMYDKDGGTNQTSLGTAFTVIVFGYSTIFNAFAGMQNVFNISNIKAGQIKPYYYNSNEAETTTGEIISFKGNDTVPCYRAAAVTVDGDTMNYYWNGEKIGTLKGSDYSDFSRWYDKVIVTYYGGATAVYYTVAAFYNRALTDAEMVEMAEYLKTLEVE